MDIISIDSIASLLFAALVQIFVVPLRSRFKLQLGEGLDFSPSMHWPEPVVDGDIEQDRGPVMVTGEYFINPDNENEFYIAAGYAKRQVEK